ncbi:MAG: tRNA guanosine(34) transglycosylase Tgt [Actinomycetota bacterium]|nr:tRNA guanosine(34) transglycosylase Tgt [Actinomycetota bacterium]
MTATGFRTEATDGSARTGTVTTPRGVIATPCFMPVGTRGVVRLLDTDDLDALAPQVVLANTYHLMLRPGAKTIAALGGLHRFFGYDGHLLTDSGGFQVFSLGASVDDDGVSFRSTYDGSRHRLTPEEAVAIQEDLGADIQMALDICPGLPAPDHEIRSATERTLAWAARARPCHQRNDQALFGIVQGGISVDLRAESAERTVALDFDGYGIGGLSVGEPLSQMLPALAAVTARLPPDRPRYLMGVGDPASMLEAVALGVDMFDCVLPTRLARHGTALTGTGRLSVRAAASAVDDNPLDADCGCRVCARHSRGYLRHLLVVGEPTAGRLLSIHNITWVQELMARAAQAIRAGTLKELRGIVAAHWERPELP